MQNSNRSFYDDSIYEAIVREAEAEIARMSKEKPLPQPKPEESKVVFEFAETLKQQGEHEQASDIVALMKYVEALQKQVGVMEAELGELKNHLAQSSKNKSEPISNEQKEISNIQKDVAQCAKKIVSVKNQLSEVSGKALSALRNKGKQAMNQVLRKGMAGIKGMLADVNLRLGKQLEKYESKAAYWDNIGNEIKQMGNSAANVGRLLAGKETKEASQDKEGVALTRIVNAPTKRKIASIRKTMERVQQRMDKIEQSYPFSTIKNDSKTQQWTDEAKSNAQIKKGVQKSLIERLETKKKEVADNSDSKTVVPEKDKAVEEQAQHNNR